MLAKASWILLLYGRIVDSLSATHTLRPAALYVGLAVNPRG